MLAYFAANTALLPRVQRVQEHVDKLEADGVGAYRKLATVVISSGERIIGHQQSAFDEQYGYVWQMLSVAPFAVMFSDLIVAGDVTIEHVEQLLTDSWIARDEGIPYGGDEMMPNDLVPLLLGPLRLYFAVDAGELGRDALIPALDSLVLRIEAVLRKLARLLGESDTKTDAEGITEYQGLTKLLGNAAITSKLGPDLTAFMQYTLMREPEGLRDRIGHAILHLGQYRSLDLNAVVLLLLRLAALDVPEKQEAVEDQVPK
jgi:hypothetical protein